MYGRYIPCYDKSSSCDCNYYYCQHTDLILKRYGSSIYDDDSLILTIIKLILSYQEKSIEEICNFDFNLKSIVEASGIKLCNYNNIVDKGCEIICGNNYQQYILDDNCKSECSLIEYSDTEYIKILQIVEYLKYPNRYNINKICGIFNWSILYTSDYLNILIGDDDVNYYSPIFNVIPIPIGVSLRILSNC